MWLPDPNCNICDPEFAPGVNLGRHNTSTQTAMNMMKIFLLRVKFRRDITSGPLKAATATCYLYSSKLINIKYQISTFILFYLQIPELYCNTCNMCYHYFDIIRFMTNFIYQYCYNVIIDVYLINLINS